MKEWVRIDKLRIAVKANLMSLTSSDQNHGSVPAATLYHLYSTHVHPAKPPKDFEKPKTHKKDKMSSPLIDQFQNKGAQHGSESPEKLAAAIRTSRAFIPRRAKS